MSTPVGTARFGLGTDSTGLRYLSVGLAGSLTLSSVVTQLGGTFPIDTSELISLTEPRVTYVRGVPFLDGTSVVQPGVRLTTGVSIPALGIQNVPFVIPLTRDNDGVMDAEVALEVG